MARESDRPPCPIRRALVSVYDKTGVVEFVRTLLEAFKIEIISTGGTARLLQENGLPVTRVEQVTGFGELLDGRVKTLHPHIHAALLADRGNPEHLRQLEAAGIKPIDLVVVDLYPFAETIAQPNCTEAQAAEWVDIGGVCLLRAAAKNHKYVFVVCGPSAFGALLTALRDGGEQALEQQRRVGAAAAFALTARYDRMIASYLEGRLGTRSESTPRGPFTLPPLGPATVLRYGENPHQVAEMRVLPTERGGGEGEEAVVAVVESTGNMSYNNYVDADAALALCKELVRASTACGGPLPGHATVIVKHTNPCGCAVAERAVDAYRQAYLGDVQAAMGGVVAISAAVDVELATAIMETYERWGASAGAGGFFVEVLIAPAIDPAALQIIRTRKAWGARVRVLAVGDLGAPWDRSRQDLRRLSGAMLFQTRDDRGLDEQGWRVATERAPTASEWADLRLAWLICKHTKSNAITLCKNGMLLGNGAGQMSRVMSCRLAVWLATENGHAKELGGAVAASDAFFPFRDGPDLLTQQGITALIQPGGSKRDRESIDLCNERDVAMVLTGTRHFRH